MTVCEGSVENAELVEEDRLRGTVRSAVMDDDLEDVVLVAQTQQPCAQQRAVLEVEGQLGVLVHEPLCRAVALGLRLGGEVDDVEGDWALRVDDLHWPAVLDLETRPERFVSAGDLAQPGSQCPDVERSAQ